MKKTFLLLAFIALITLPSLSQVFTSGFETWTTTAPIKPTDWVGVKTSFAADSITQYTASVHGGTYACKLQSRTTSHKRLTTQAVTITAGDSYTITFWVKGHGSIRTGLYNGGATAAAYHYNSYITVNSSTWAQQSQTIANDTNCTSAEFIISVKQSFADLSDIQIDDVTITAGTAQTVSIHDIQYSTTSPYDSPYNNQIVNTGGIVTGKYNKGFFMQSGSGLWNGILVYDSTAASTLAIGDSVTFTGTVTEYYNMTELKTISGLVKVSSGNTVPAPYPVTGANSRTEGVESVLVKLTDVPCVVAPNAYGEWAVYDTDTTYIDDLMYHFTSLVGTHYDITGIVYYTYGEFFTEPRDASDIQLHVGINEFNKNSVGIYPNPVSSNLFLNNIEGIENIKISNILGETIDNIKVNSTNTTVNVSNLSDGIYFITMTDKNGIAITKKFSKK